MLDSFLQDLRFALRTLARRPAFTALAVLILALGIGSNTAIFSVAHGVLLSPLPYGEPDRLVELWPRVWINKRAVLAVEERMSSFAGVSGHATWSLPLSGGGGEPEVATVGRVSPQHFDVLGVRPTLGRSFAAGERNPGEHRVAVLSHGLWQRRYGGDPSILGRTIELDTEPYTVIGVMPEGHLPLVPEWQLWVPLTVDRGDPRDLDSTFYIDLTARLAPDVTVSRAAAELRALAASLNAENPQRFTTDRVEAAEVVELREHLVGAVQPTILVLLGAVGFILLIACANVANLLLARSTGRRQEMAVRTALGASRRRMLRQLLTESLVLSLLGGGAGLMAAAWTFNLLLGQLPADLPRATEIALDGPVLGFSLLASLLAAAMFGLAPALRSVRSDLETTLREGAGRLSPGRHHQRFTLALVAFQIAASVTLLVGAGLMLRSLAQLRGVDPGFRGDQVLAMRLVPPSSQHQDATRLLAYYEQVLTQVRAVPGVLDAGAIHLLPLGFGNWNFPYRFEGQEFAADAAAGTPLPAVNFRAVTPGYFRTMGITVLKGRTFTDSDRDDAPAVGVINRRMAETLWPGEDPIGKQIFLFGSDDNAFTVVGVVGDVRQHRLSQAARPEMYWPHAQSGTLGVTSMVILARTVGHPPDHADALRAAAWSVDPGVPITEMRPLRRTVEASTAETRFVAFLIAGFAALALALGMAGIYGVLSYAVAERTAEIGIRMVLGAERRDVFREIFGRGLTVTAVGLGAGVLTAWVLGRYLASLLFEIAPTDAVTYIAVVLLISAAAVASIWRPARRASTVDPAAALRHG
ncbi:MAG: ABC transporter permease [Thermoanaerobaculia bacterium]